MPTLQDCGGLHRGLRHPCSMQWTDMLALACQELSAAGLWHASLHACRPTPAGRPALQLTDLEVEELLKSFLSHCKVMGTDAEAIAPLLDYCSHLTQNQPGPFVILLDTIAQVGLAVTCLTSGQQWCCMVACHKCKAPYCSSTLQTTLDVLQDRMYEYVLSRGLYSTMRVLRSLQR